MKRFIRQFTPDSDIGLASPDVLLSQGLRGMAVGSKDFLRRYSGSSFNEGLYRIHSLDRMDVWTANVSQAFPDFKERIVCFSYDWLGRHFALDYGRRKNGKPLILMLEPGTGEALEIPADFEAFHNDELVSHPDEALAASFYRDWLQAEGSRPSMNECIGYVTPLFLGGGDVVENLEVSDMDVYWSICAGLLTDVRGLPKRARLGRIDMTE